MKQGFIYNSELYGENNFTLNSFCKLAGWAGDKETARSLFQRIGDKWDMGAWASYKDFSGYKTWALSNN